RPPRRRGRRCAGDRERAPREHRQPRRPWPTPCGSQRSAAAVVKKPWHELVAHDALGHPAPDDLPDRVEPAVLVSERDDPALAVLRVTDPELAKRGIDIGGRQPEDLATPPHRKSVV